MGVGGDGSLASLHVEVSDEMYRFRGFWAID